MHRPTSTHCTVAEQILCYLKHNIISRLLLTKYSSISSHEYSGADSAGDPNDHCSINDFYIFLDSNLVSWSAKKRCTMIRSSTESEYKGLAHATCELI